MFLQQYILFLVMTKYQHQNVWLADNHRTEVWPLDSIKKIWWWYFGFWVVACNLFFFSKKDFGVRFWLKLKNLEQKKPNYQEKNQNNSDFLRKKKEVILPDTSKQHYEKMFIAAFEKASKKNMTQSWKKFLDFITMKEAIILMRTY